MRPSSPAPRLPTEAADTIPASRIFACRRPISASCAGEGGPSATAISWPNCAMPIRRAAGHQPAVRNAAIPANPPMVHPMPIPVVIHAGAETGVNDVEEDAREGRQQRSQAHVLRNLRLLGKLLLPGCLVELGPCWYKNIIVVLILLLIVQLGCVTSGYINQEGSDSALAETTAAIEAPDLAPETSLPAVSEPTSPSAPEPTAALPTTTSLPDYFSQNYPVSAVSYVIPLSVRHVTESRV